MKVARLLGTADEFVFFTSGSTESNNMAVLGLEEYGIRSGKRHIVTTAIEHKSILEPCRHLEKKGFEIEYVLPHEDGRVHAEDVVGRVRPDTLLVSVMHVNNETGTIQPVEEIGKALEGQRFTFTLTLPRAAESWWRNCGGSGMTCSPPRLIRCTARRESAFWSSGIRTAEDRSCALSCTEAARREECVLEPCRPL